MDPLAQLVLSYLDDPEVELRPAYPELELGMSTWSYGVPADGFDGPSVAAALQHVAHKLANRFGGQPGTVYCWYDEQAGQLRLSLSSLPADRLPFGGDYRSTVDVSEVLQLAATDVHPGTLAWEELTEVAESGHITEESAPPLTVWAAFIAP